MEIKKTTWDRLVWTFKPASEREAGDSVVRNLLLHWFPAKVTRQSLSFRYSFWLGTISALLFGILTVTGVVLMFLYVPSVERALRESKVLAERRRAELQLRDSREQLRALSVYLQHVREEEQIRIAREVHDELGQQLTGLKLELTWLCGRLPKNLEQIGRAHV